MKLSEQGYNKCGYMILIGISFYEYDTIEEMQDDFSYDKDNQELRLFEKYILRNNVMYEQVTIVKDVEMLKVYCHVIDFLNE